MRHIYLKACIITLLCDACNKISHLTYQTKLCILLSLETCVYNIQLEILAEQNIGSFTQKQGKIKVYRDNFDGFLLKFKCGWGLLNTCTCTCTCASTFNTTSCIHIILWPSCLKECMEAGTRECRREGNNDFDRYAVAALRRGVVVVGHLPRLPLTSTLWHYCTFLLTSLSFLADRRVQSFSSGSIVSLAFLKVLQHGKDRMWFCTVFLILRI